MGYNLGAKAAALGLLALTNGDRAEAEKLWGRIRHANPSGIEEALDLVDAARAATDGPPWASAQVIMWDDGAYLPQLAQRDPRTDGGYDKGWWTTEGQDGRWLSPERLVRLIGGADVRVLA